MLLQSLITFSQAHSHILADNPGNGFAPGTGSAPPGGDKFMKIFGWVAWGVTGLCVVGILIVAGKMAVSHRRGEGGEHATGLAWVLGAAVLIGASSSLVGVLTSP
jgi:hypothetical protein